MINNFEQIYNDTYDEVFKFILCKCKKVDAINDILQEVYLEFYKIIHRKDIEENKILPFLIGISKNKIKQHYSFLDRLKELSFHNKIEEKEYLDILADDINIETELMETDFITEIWDYIKRKDYNTVKIFIFYYKYDFTIKEIAIQLNQTESYIKNRLYRTLKELNIKYRKEKSHE